MKNYLRLFVLIPLIAFIFTACDSSTEPEGGLAGIWELSQIRLTAMGQTITVTAAMYGITSTVTLNANGTFVATTTTEDGVETDTGTWTTSGNILTITDSFGNTQTGTYTISGNTLTFHSSDGFGGEYGDGSTDLIFTRR